MHPLEGFMCAEEHFQARLDDVLLITLPKECGVAKRRRDGKLSTSPIGGSTKILGSMEGIQSCR